MAQYSDLLKFVHERNGGDWAAIGLDRYTLHDEAHREELNDKIFQHYLNEEVGHETDSMFRQSMRSRMQLIMPRYNELYKSIDMEYDPLITVDMSTDTESEASADSTNQTDMDASATSESTTAGTTKSDSDTTANSSSESTNSATSDGTGSSTNYVYPQQAITANGAYATSGGESASGSTSSGETTETGEQTQNTSDTGEQNQTTQGETGQVQSTTGTSDTSETANSSVRQKGRGQSAQSLIAEYRNNIMNIDEMIVVELEDLFMGTWTTGNAPGPSGYYGINRPYMFGY